MTITRKFVLVVEGDTEEDYERALEEAIKQVREGFFLVVANRDECSAYYVTSTTLVAEQERPYRG